MKRPIKELPDHATRCLGCACRNPENEAARVLLRYTHAHSRVGVLAAAFVAGNSERYHILELTREAIAEQRRYCVHHGHRHSSRCSIPRK